MAEPGRTVPVRSNSELKLLNREFLLGALLKEMDLNDAALAEIDRKARPWKHGELCVRGQQLRQQWFQAMEDNEAQQKSHQHQEAKGVTMFCGFCNNPITWK